MAFASVKFRDNCKLVFNLDCKVNVLLYWIKKTGEIQTNDEGILDFADPRGDLQNLPSYNNDITQAKDVLQERKDYILVEIVKLEFGRILVKPLLDNLETYYPTLMDKLRESAKSHAEIENKAKRQISSRIRSRPTSAKSSVKNGRRKHTR